MSQREPPIPPPFDAPGWVQDQYNREVDEWHAWKDSQKSSTGNGEYKKGAAKAPSIMDESAKGQGFSADKIHRERVYRRRRNPVGRTAKDREELARSRGVLRSREADLSLTMFIARKARFCTSPSKTMSGGSSRASANCLARQ